MRARFHEKDIFLACRTLFGPEIQLSLDFLGYLQPSGAKTAFREKAKQNHPDLFTTHSLEVQHQQAEVFRQVREAFNLIKDFLKHRDETYGQSVAQVLQHPSVRRYYRPTPPQASRRKPPAGHYYQGTVPLRPLEFGSYIYYRGLVPYQVLIDALVWQRRQRPSIGEIACHWKWLSDAQVLRICRDRGGYGRFGEKAVRLGLLRQNQVRTLLYFQRSQQQKIGQYFLETGILCSSQIEQLIEEMQVHNARINNSPSSKFTRKATAG